MQRAEKEKSAFTTLPPSGEECDFSSSHFQPGHFATPEHQRVFAQRICEPFHTDYSYDISNPGKKSEGKLAFDFMLSGADVDGHLHLEKNKFALGKH